MSVLNARRLLATCQVRHLPVVEDGLVVGMLSDRDLTVGDRQVARSLSTLQSELVAGRYRTVATVMTSPVRTIRPHDPLTLAAREMMRARVGALPVVERGVLVGILTTTDCLAALLEVLGERRRGATVSRSPAEDDPEWFRMNPMPPGDERPGRGEPARAAQPARQAAGAAASVAPPRVREDPARPLVGAP